MKKKRRRLTIEVICRTNEEHLLMLVLIVVCQHFYRKFKKAKKQITIFRITNAAREAYNQKQLKKPKQDRSEIIWG